VAKSISVHDLSKEFIATKNMKILLRQMIRIIEMNAIYKEWYGNYEYGILKLEDPLLFFHSNGLIHVTSSLNFT
jgi:hypothetical protein